MEKFENIEFKNPEEVLKIYDNLIEEYNEVLIAYEELEAIDDNLQELRAVNLDRYDYGIMSDMYASIGDKYTADELLERIDECEVEISELREKLAGVRLSEHLINFWNMEQKKEQYEILISACEKYLEKSKKRKEMEKKKEKIRPASPKREPEVVSMRPMSPRRSGGSYTPVKASPKVISDENDDVKIAPLPVSEPVKIAPLPVVAPTTSKKKKSEPVALPLPAPAPVPVPLPLPVAASTEEAPKKKGGRKKA